MHVGTFTPEGTWRAAAAELEELARLGITVIEMMPIADFAGRFGWGYDGVNLYAPAHVYGTPDDLRAFVDRAHAAGLGVILDVVYNHLGPDGNYLADFSPDYFTDRYTNDWGRAINFEGPPAARAFFVENAGYWIDEYPLRRPAARRDAGHQGRLGRARHCRDRRSGPARRPDASASTSSRRTSRRTRCSSGRCRTAATASMRSGTTTITTPRWWR